MSDWINFVKEFAAQNGLTYGQALVQAAPYYKKGGYKQSNRNMRNRAVGRGQYPRSTYDVSDFLDRGRYDDYNRSEITRRINNNFNTNSDNLRYLNQYENYKRSGNISGADAVLDQMYNAGVLLGGVLTGGADPAPKGALAALLSGLNATVKVE